MTFAAFNNPNGGTDQNSLDLSEQERATYWKLIADPDLLDNDHKPPFVSLIVTAYNYEQFVNRCLLSVAAQTYRYFECIVVDDRSSDGTRVIAESTLATLNDPRFSIIAPATNLGQLGAQAYGFTQAKGQFIVFVDADDLLKPNFIERHLYAHLNMPTVVGFTSSDQWHIDAEGGILSFHHPDLAAAAQSARATPVAVVADGDKQALNGAILPRATLKEGLAGWWWATQSTMMFRRGILQLVLPDPEAGEAYRICADFYLARFAQFLSSSAILCEALGSYRRHGKNHFCSNPLLTSNVPVGDMRKHPKSWQFYELALHLLEQQAEAFIAVLGEWEYDQFVRNFHLQRERLNGHNALKWRTGKWRFFQR